MIRRTGLLARRTGARDDGRIEPGNTSRTSAMAARRATLVRTSPPQWLASTASSVLGCERFPSSSRQKRDHHKLPVGGLNPQEQPVYLVHSVFSGRAETRPLLYPSLLGSTAPFVGLWPFLLGGL